MVEGLGGASVTKMQCVGLLATGSANFAEKTDRASSCVRAHRVGYSIQALLGKLFVTRQRAKVAAPETPFCAKVIMKTTARGFSAAP